MQYLYVKRMFLLVCMIFYCNELHTEGFVAGTMVKVPHGYTRIEDLQKGDCIICLNLEKDLVESHITYVSKKMIPQYAKVHMSNESVGVSRSQQFYRKNENIWVNVEDLKNGYVLSDSGIVVELINEPVEVYLIGVAQYHNFFVTKNEICVHNFFPPIVLAISAVFGLGSVELTTISAGIAGLSAFFGYQWHKKNKEKHKIAIETQFYNGGMIPEDPDDEKKRKRNEARDNFQPLTNQQARNKAKELGYRETKNHPCGYTHDRPVFTNGKDFISPDKYGHRGGIWKLFDKTGERIATVNIDLTKVIGT